MGECALSYHLAHLLRRSSERDSKRNAQGLLRRKAETAKVNSLERSLTRKQPLESPLSGGANLFLNHHVLLLTVTAHSVQLSVPPLSKAYLPNPFASLNCNHWLPPQNGNLPAGLPRARLGPRAGQPGVVLPLPHRPLLCIGNPQTGRNSNQAKVCAGAGRPLSGIAKGRLALDQTAGWAQRERLGGPGSGLGCRVPPSCSA